MDPRDDRTSTIRSRLLNILHERIRIPNPHAPGLPALPPSSTGSEAPRLPTQQHLPQNVAAPKPQTQNGQPGQSTQLPMIDFDSGAPPDLTVGRGLSPITERNMTRETLGDLVQSHSHSISGEHPAPESVMMSRSMSSEKPDSVMSSGHQNSMSLSVSEHSQSQLLPQRTLLNPVPEGASVHSSITGIPQSRSPPPTMSSWSDSKLTPSLETTRTKSTEATNASANVDMGAFKLPLTPESPGSPTFSTSSTTPSSGMGKPTSPGMSLSSLMAPVPIKSSVSRSPPPISRPISSLTSPYSPKGKEKELPSILDVEDSVELPPRALSPPFTTLPLHSASSPPLPPKARSPAQTTVPSSSMASVPVAPVAQQDSQSIFSDALFYMQQLGDKPSYPPRRVPTTISERSSDEGSVSDKPLHAPLARRGAPVAFSEPGTETNFSEPITIGSRPPLGRKPSGARVQPTSSRGLNVEATSLISSSPEHLHTSQATMADPQKVIKKKDSGDDANADALAALSFLATEAPAQPAPAPQPPPPPPRDLSPELTMEGSAASGSSEGVTQYRSSFAPSKQAEQRKARAEAQHQAVLHKPGRANGKRMSAGNRLSGWNESSDEEEEEEEEEEDDEDADSDDEPPSATESKKPTPATPSAAPIAPTRPLRPSSAGRAVTSAEHAPDANAHLQSRRNLPPVPAPGQYPCSHLIFIHF